MISTSRRSLITGLAALVAAPAIVKVASIMPVNSKLVPGIEYNGLLTLDEYAERILGPMVDQLADEVAKNVMNNGTHWRVFHENGQLSAESVRLDILYGSTDKSLSSEEVRARMEAEIETRLHYNKERRSIDFVEYWHGWKKPETELQVPATLALAAAAVAVAPEILAKPVTRRFWGK